MIIIIQNLFFYILLIHGINFEYIACNINRTTHRHTRYEFNVLIDSCFTLKNMLAQLRKNLISLFLGIDQG